MEQRYDSYDDEQEIYPDVVGPADADAEADDDVDVDLDAEVDNTAGVGDGDDNAEESDGSLYRYTVKDTIFFPED